MKLASLLSEFLLNNNQLSLPGIGRLQTGSGQHIATDLPGKHHKILPVNLVFESDPGTAEDPSLIDFIANATGKQKALATADLRSQMELVHQFLNIGKPYYIEGLGSFSKLPDGSFQFSPGFMKSEKISTRSSKSDPEQPAGSLSGFKEIFYKGRQRSGIKRNWAILLFLAGIGFAVWGGYQIYINKIKRRAAESSQTQPEKEQEVQMAYDSLSISKTDSIKPGGPAYKFVIETAGKERALARYRTLTGYGVGIQMETTDSVQFQLFFLIPCAATDTSRILDSLQIIYTPQGKKAFMDGAG